MAAASARTRQVAAEADDPVTAAPARTSRKNAAGTQRMYCRAWGATSALYTLRVMRGGGHCVCVSVVCKDWDRLGKGRSLCVYYRYECASITDMSVRACRCQCEKVCLVVNGNELAYACIITQT